jgi:ABC-2 type transport system permease protein
VKVLAIAGSSLRRLSRDRMALFFMLGLPVAIILLVGSATAQFDADAIPVGVVNEDSGPLSNGLVRSLDREGSIDLEVFDERADLAKSARRAVVAAGVFVPEGYDAMLRSGHPARVELLVDQTQGSAAAARSLVSGVISRHGAIVQAADFATKNGGGAFDDNLGRAQQLSGSLDASDVAVETAKVGVSSEDEGLGVGIDSQPARNLVLFVFIASMAGAAALIESRRLGVIRRMLGTPTSAGTILAGETLGRFGIAAVQALFIYLVGTLIFAVSWGSPLGALSVIVLWVLLSTAVGMLFGTLFRNPEQASSIGPPVGIALGMLGGTMWPLEIVPDSMRTLGHVFPHAWAMDAWNELVGRGAGIGDIATELGVLAGFIAVLFPLALWRLRRVLVAP